MPPQANTHYRAWARLHADARVDVYGQRLPPFIDMPHIVGLPAFRDNYIWLILDRPGPSFAGQAPLNAQSRQSGARRCVVVDPGDASPVIAFLEATGVELAGLLITHRHCDHVGGVRALTARWPCPVYGPAGESIAEVTHPVRDNDHICFYQELGQWQVMEIPGHTEGHVAYLGDHVLFCGDALFAAGCGRLLGGTAKQLYASLEKIARLPTTTRVYCGHEYTLANLAFAREVDPDNADLARRWTDCRKHRCAGLPTVPFTLEEELATNPFLRCTQTPIREAVSRYCGRALSAPDQIFAELRRWKDNF